MTSILLTPSAQAVVEATTSPDGPARLRAAAREAGAVAVVFGRVPDADDQGPAIDPSVAALHFGLSVADLGVFVAAAPGPDAPYNLARRVLSLDHFLAGRAGVLLEAGTDDAAQQQAADLARLLRELWNSWPLDAVVGDRETGVFAEADRIRRVEHRSSYTVDGPLTTPGSVQGEPVLLWQGGGATSDADLATDGTTTNEVTLRPLRALPASPRQVAVVGRLGDPEPHRTLRELLGLAPRTLDTSDWPRAFAAATPTGAA